MGLSPRRWLIYSISVILQNAWKNSFRQSAECLADQVVCRLPRHSAEETIKLFNRETIRQTKRWMIGISTFLEAGARRIADVKRPTEIYWIKKIYISSVLARKVEIRKGVQEAEVDVCFHIAF